MMDKKHIGIFVGSLRKEAFSKKIAEQLIALSPKNLTLEIIPIGQLALYNQDFDDHDEAPENYKEFREIVKQLDACLFVTPEYNRGIPAVLKNAIDVASRPGGKGVWGKKPGAVISSSPGMLGGFGANHHLRQTLTSVNIYMMQQPEIYLSQIGKAFDENGKLDEHTTEYLKKFMTAFVDWCTIFWK
ncbi:NAD(P)H-dependent oxidoreductase [Soonwooa sp.]|uniref:NADPH-dependent FMN reductase n=1 Tax=Soonwooa sp. TaxID=1938592 RepID=UPI00289EB687|nr:NAD(P)H-dependent oxidoreductase [Soonwooa sp.]